MEVFESGGISNLAAKIKAWANATFSKTDTTYSAATQSAQGLMSADDKKKLDGIAAGAQVNNIPYLGMNPTGGTANDTRAWWAGKGTCYAYFSATSQINGQPAQYGFLISLVSGPEVHQEWWTQLNGAHYRRGGNGNTTAMPSWTALDTNTTYSARSGYGIAFNGTQIGLGRTVLYNNASGTNGTVTLSASAASYNHMRVFYKNNNSGNSLIYNSTSVYSPNGKIIPLITFITNTSITTKSGNRSISGTSMTVANKDTSLWISSTDQGGAAENCIYVLRVEAWNE